LIHGNIDIIPDLTLLLLEAHMTSTSFPAALMALLLEVPTSVVTSIVPAIVLDPTIRVESSVEAAGANIHQL
jgi:hypothetical protein